VPRWLAVDGAEDVHRRQVSLDLAEEIVDVDDEQIVHGPSVG
jgi:hypothetical protein